MSLPALSQPVTPPAFPPLPQATRFARVPVHGREVLAASTPDGIRVPMKSFCGALGLPWDGQRQRIQRDPHLKAGASIMLVPSARGEQRQVTLPAEMIAGFLFGCDVDRFAPELRERVLLFQRECYQVLHAHFSGLAKAEAVAAPDRSALHRASARLVTRLVDATDPVERRHLHALLEQNCADLGLIAPRLDAIGVDAPSLDALVGHLVEATRVLDARRRRWNHIAAQSKLVLALQLPELARLFAAADVDFDVEQLRTALERGSSERFRVTRRTIDSAITGKPVFAWVVEEWR